MDKNFVLEATVIRLVKEHITQIIDKHKTLRKEKFQQYSERDPFTYGFAEQAAIHDGIIDDLTYVLVDLCSEAERET